MSARMPRPVLPTEPYRLEIGAPAMPQLEGSIGS